MTTYIIDKRYTATVERTDRVLEVAESFGLGLDDKEFVVFDNQPITINQGDVVYITGQSGSGKSTLLRELQQKMTEEGLSVADLDKVELLDLPVTDQIGKTQKEGLEFLAMTGINDAFLYIRKPAELSDGQRYRFRLGKLIESGAKVWVADEFLAVLDRDTAKVIAFSLQRAARAVGATLMVATTHKDMLDDLAPDLFVEKRYRERIRIVTKEELEALKEKK